MSAEPWLVWADPLAAIEGTEVAVSCSTCGGSGEVNACDICGVDEDGNNTCGHAGMCPTCKGVEEKFNREIVDLRPRMIEATVSAYRSTWWGIEETFNRKTVDLRPRMIGELARVASQSKADVVLHALEVGCGAAAIDVTQAELDEAIAALPSGEA